MRVDAAADWLIRLAVAGLLCVAGMGLLMVALHTTPLLGYTMLGGALGGVAMLLSGNLRLACLWGLLLTAPLDLSKRFVKMPHMGGEAAFRIELVDFFILGLIFFLVRDVLRGSRPYLRFPKVMNWWILIAALGVLAVAMGPLRTPPAHEVFRIFKSLVLMFVLVNEIVRVRQFQHVAIALMVGVMLQAVIGLTQYFFEIRLGLEALGEADEETVDFLARATLERGETVYRVGALIGHANLLAAYNALLLPIGIALLFAKIKLPYKIFIGATVVMGQAVLIATLSRAGWVSFGVAATAVLVLTLFHKRMRIRFTLLRAGLVAGAVLVVVVFSGPVTARIFQSDPGAVNVRWEWLETAWAMIQDRPILGVGLNNYVFAQAPYSPELTPAGLQRRYGDYWPVVHNIYALTWAEQGIIGLALFLGMHAHVFIIAIGNLRTKNDLLYALNIGCMCGFGAIMIDGLASFYIRNPDCARTWWIVIAIIWAIRYWRLANEGSGRTIDATPSIGAGRTAASDV